VRPGETWNAAHGRERACALVNGSSGERAEDGERVTPRARECGRAGAGRLRAREGEGATLGVHANGQGAVEGARKRGGRRRERRLA
jgi:hypothetical protein